MIQETNQQLVDQYLFHAFIYYKLNESFISDIQYEQIIIKIKENSPMIWEQNIEFADIVKQGLKSGAHTITKYPSHIVSSAIQLIYHQKYDGMIGFDEYLSRLGYCISI